MPKIATITVGVNESPIVGELLKLDSVKLDVICSNVLDFELPPLVENASNVWHRLELRNVLKQIGSEDFKISKSLKSLLQENDRLGLSDEYLSITSHISQIDQNSSNIFVAYELLVELTKKENVKLIPLINESLELLALKNKRYAPLRYFALKEELLPDAPLPLPDKQKRKLNDKKLTIEGMELLNGLKLSEQAFQALENSDLVVILPTDLLSFGVLVRAEELEKQIKAVQTPSVLVWPFSSQDEFSDTSKEIADAIGTGTSVVDFADDLSFLTDYVILDKKEKEKLDALRDAGCHVLLSDFYDEDQNLSSNLFDTILNVGSLETLIVDGNNEDEELEVVVKAENEESDNGDVKGKKISQLIESPEEAGIKAVDESVIEEIEGVDEEKIADVIEDIKDLESQNGDDDVEEIVETPEVVEDVIEEEKNDAPLVVGDEDTDVFIVEEDESWSDATKRAIEMSMTGADDLALQWLVHESDNDSDNEVQIAELIIEAWMNARSTSDRKRGVVMISALSQKHRESYIQILQRIMVQVVAEKLEDRRRTLITLFALVHDIDFELLEHLVRNVIKELAGLSDNADLPVTEHAKLTILQLVIQSRRLSRVTIRELLSLLETKPNIGPEIWNILLSFDAGSVALELVTNFSISKVDEIIRRSNLLRFTGSFYSTLTKVIQAWKEGDKAIISSITGTIIPEETLRKFDRLELARKLSKLKMVQLVTLAESLSKDVETVERLITELIVNDELHAEMKLIDDKMYLVSTVEEEESSS